MLCLYLLERLCRYIMIKPNDVLTIRDEIEQNAHYKFIYDARDSVNIKVFDSEGKKAVDTYNQSGCLYLQVNQSGLFTVNITNNSKRMMKFSYKAPDVTKEITGNLGYVEDSDLVGELARLLDKVIEQQRTHVERSYKHYEMVKSSRKWVRFLVVFELGLTGLAVYLMHKDFIAVFETRRKI